MTLHRTISSFAAAAAALALLASCSDASPEKVAERPSTDAPALETPGETPRGTKVLGTQSGPRVTRLAVVGDYGMATEDEYRVARTMKRWARRSDVRTFVTTGDNIYPSGHPDQFEAAWEVPYGWVKNRDLKIAASLGNHDIQTDNGAPVMELLEMPARRYHLRRGPVDLFMLDSNDNFGRQRRWLRRELRAATAPWQVVAFHHPPFNCGAHGVSDRALEHWVPILSRHGADLVLNGHDHNYQRFARRRGVTYVITGGGGAGLYGIEDCPSGQPALVASKVRYHFLKVGATRSSLSVRVVRPGGHVLDRFSL